MENFFRRSDRIKRIMWSMILVCGVAGTLSASTTVDATTYTDHYGDSLRVVEDYIGHISVGYWARYDNVEFEEDYDSVRIEHGGENRGYLDFFLDSLTGVFFASCSTEATGDWHVFTSSNYAIHGSYTGTHSFFIEFSGGGFFYEGVGNYKSFIFFGPDGVSKRYDPAAWGPIAGASGNPPRIMVNLSTSENAQLSQHDKVLGVFDVRGRVVRLLAPSSRSTVIRLPDKPGTGAGQAFIVIPGE